MKKFITFILSFLLIGGMFAQEPVQMGSLQKNLIGYWSLSQSSLKSAVILADGSAYGNHGTSANTPSFTTDQRGQANMAMEFNGTTDKVDTGTDMIGTSALTVSCWIYADNWGEGNAGRIVDNGKFYMRMVSGGYMFVSSDGSTNVVATGFSYNWYNIIVTRALSGDVIIYVNGTENVIGNSGTPEVGTTNVIIGNNNAQSATFNGEINEVRLYNVVKTLPEITEIYNSYHPDFNITNNGADAMSGWDFTSGWTTSALTTINSATQFTTTGSGYVAKNPAVINGVKYRIHLAGSTTSTIGVNIEFGAVSSSFNTGTFDTVFDITPDAAFITIRNGNAGITDITTLDVRVKTSDYINVGN